MLRSPVHYQLGYPTQTPQVFNVTNNLLYVHHKHVSLYAILMLQMQTTVQLFYTANVVIIYTIIVHLTH